MTYVRGKAVGTVTITTTYVIGYEHTQVVIATQTLNIVS